jgi:hypothetical protein
MKVILIRGSFIRQRIPSPSNKLSLKREGKREGGDKGGDRKKDKRRSREGGRKTSLALFQAGGKEGIRQEGRKVL